jgi:tetratricopeptide (TPR) repeat protein
VRKLIFAVAVCVLASLSASAQTSSEPYWLLYEQGNAFYAQKEYGLALRKYQDAISGTSALPEAEMAIGDIYKQEGETELAVRQYEKAYNLRNYFTIPEDKYTVLYRIAAVAEEQLDYRKMEESLLLIVNDDMSFNEPATSRIKEQIESNYYGKGLDYVLKLYRLTYRFAESAHAKLGWFYYKTGLFTKSALHLLYAVTYTISEASNSIASKDVDFQFTTLKDFLQVSRPDKDVTSFIQDSGLWNDLYYLAGSTFKAGYPSHAQFIWTLLSQIPSAGKFVDLSKRQLKTPWIEPYLQIPIIPRNNP